MIQRIPTFNVKGVTKRFSDVLLRKKNIKYVMSEVNNSNDVSLRAHLKGGFKILATKKNSKTVTYLLIKFKNKTVHKKFIIDAATSLCLKDLK
jgi:hypothetical protein